jgi:hypothetical protein
MAPSVLHHHHHHILSSPTVRSLADITKQNIFISAEVFPNFLLVILISLLPSPTCYFQFFLYYCPRTFVTCEIAEQEKFNDTENAGTQSLSRGLQAATTSLSG